MIDKWQMIDRKRFIMGVGSHGYRERVISPMNAICKVENEESQCCTSVWVWKPEKWKMFVLIPNLGLNSQEPGELQSKGKRNGWCSSSSRKGVNSPFFHLFALLELSTDWKMPTFQWVKAMSFTVSPFSHANLFPYRHPGITIYQLFGNS